MEELNSIGINEELNTILEMCPNVKDLSKEEVLEKINILRSVNCDDKRIKNIIVSNPFFLEKMPQDVLQLIQTLREYGFTLLDLLFDSNPLILNLESFEVLNYIEERKNNGEALEDIIDDLDSNPWLFNEM